MRAKKFNINVYTLFYAEDSDRRSPKSMFFNTLHEVKNPQGVFIIIESNAELKNNISEEIQDQTDIEFIDDWDVWVEI